MFSFWEGGGGIDERWELIKEGGRRMVCSSQDVLDIDQHLHRYARVCVCVSLVIYFWAAELLYRQQSVPMNWVVSSPYLVS